MKNLSVVSRQRAKDIVMHLHFRQNKLRKVLWTDFYTIFY
jgi:hypothetical protein